MLDNFMVSEEIKNFIKDRRLNYPEETLEDNWNVFTGISWRRNNKVLRGRFLASYMEVIRESVKRNKIMNQVLEIISDILCNDKTEAEQLHEIYEIALKNIPPDIVISMKIECNENDVFINDLLMIMNIIQMHDDKINGIKLVIENHKKRITNVSSN